MHNILYLQICSASCKYFCMYGDKIIIIAGVTNFCCLSSKKIHVSLGNMKRRFIPFFTLWRFTDSCVRVAAASPWVFKRNLGYLKIFKIVSFQTATQPDSESDTASILWCKDWHTYPCWDWRTLPCFQSSDHLNPCNNFYVSLHCQTNQGCSRSKVTVSEFTLNQHQYRLSGISAPQICTPSLSGQSSEWSEITDHSTSDFHAYKKLRWIPENKNEWLKVTRKGWSKMQGRFSA